MINLKLFQRIVTSGVIATSAVLVSSVAKVQAATFTLPIEAAAKATGVDVLRDSYGLDGTGITIGVMSDSFDTSTSFNSSGKVDNYATNIADGYLPSNIQVLEDYADPDPTVVDPNTDPIDEGRAILQLIYAVAPGANFIFYTSEGGVDSFGQGIQALAAAGADIIVDDRGYVPSSIPDVPSELLDAEPPDGPINQAIDTAVNQGISYFAAAGNNFSDGISIYGHANNPNALTVGAVYYGNAESYSNQAFDVVVEQGELEPFSSEGNPGSQKPDVVAPDGLPISFNLGGESRSYDDDPNFFSFFGTSASAPFTAAVAALLQQADPSATPTEIYDALRSTAYNSSSGFDSRSGFGLIRGDQAILALGVEPQPITIPEPSAAPALLCVSVLIAGLLLKRNQQRSKTIAKPTQNLALVHLRVDELSYEPLPDAS
ncbi:MAG: S8 family serine peptidase [Scytonema sp. RU_4_4]|nr:S8 family serine peptidase [Scytonema sp. RU_4_4]NJR73636.1 S8 family serine peptidase [Scytonema sp. CRU_2_7]